MRKNILGQGFKVFYMLFICLFVLTGCMRSQPYSSPWEVSYPTTDAERAKAKTQSPDMGWRTEAKRESLHVYYDDVKAQRNIGKRPIYGQENRDSQQYQSRHSGAIAQETLKAISSNNTSINSHNKKITVALLLPMSGKYKNLGQSMMNAAQMALFDLDGQAFRLLPKDTKGTAQGSRKAALEAAEAGADLILGPVFSKNVAAAKAALAYTEIPLIAYTTDWKMAGKNAYVMGFLPFSQVIRVVNYAQNHGYSKTGFFGTGNDYSKIVMRTLHYSLRNRGSRVARTGQFSIAQPDLHMLVQDFIGVDIPDETEPGANTSARTTIANDITLPFDSVLIPVGGQTLKSVTNMFGYYNVDKKRVRFLGTGLWDDESLSNEPTLYGSWFAAPDPNLRADFERRYEENYGEKPERLASLAYDSLALAIVLAKTYDGSGAPYARERLVTGQGYAGIDGIFRFRADNLVERGLAVLEVTSSGMKVIDPAPDAFFALNN